MKKKEYHIGIRHHERDLNYKLRYVAKYDGRSANAHILYLIRRNIWEFEAKNGEIEVPKDEN